MTKELTNAEFVEVIRSNYSRDAIAEQDLSMDEDVFYDMQEALDRLEKATLEISAHELNLSSTREALNRTEDELIKAGTRIKELEEELGYIHKYPNSALARGDEGP